MTAMPADPLETGALLKGALITGLANAVINGAIQAFLLAGQGPVALSTDAISTGSHSVLGNAVMLATSLAMILTAIGHLTLKADKRPFLPHGLWLVIKHGLFAFGAVVVLAVLWQRFAGTVVVGVPVAVVILGLVAGIVAATVNAMTIVASVVPRR